MLPITKYTLAKVNLVRAACPQELMASMDNMAIGRPIIIEANRRKFGYVEATDYFPKAIVVSGADERSRLLAEGVIHALAFVENGSMEITAADSIQYRDLMDTIAHSLNQRLYGRDVPAIGQVSATIDEIYPLENLFTFQLSGQKYSQAYHIHSAYRKLTLVGQSIAACGAMPPVQTGARYSSATMRPVLTAPSYGAKNSELVIEIIRDWTNVQHAVDAYVSGMRAGFTRQLRPSFQPVVLDDQRKSGEEVDRGNSLRGALVKAGIDVFEFAKWSLEAQQKFQTRDGKKIPKSKFAWTPSDDPSSWKLPIDTPGRKRNALSRINQTDDIPADKKTGVLGKVRRAAEKSGVDVSEKPTSGQRSWVGHKS